MTVKKERVSKVREGYRETPGKNAKIWVLKEQKGKETPESRGLEGSVGRGTLHRGGGCGQPPSSFSLLASAGVPHPSD